LRSGKAIKQMETDAPSGAKPTFVCGECGKTHEGLPKDRGYQLPDDVWAIPKDERENKAKFTKDLCQLGDRYFIRCILKVPFVNSDEYFGWGLWAETDWSFFQRYLDLYEKDGSREPPHAGTIANRLPFYEDAFRARVLIQIAGPKDRPSLFFSPEAESILAADQRRGIGMARYHELLGVLV
jgi:hypothetical protein